jgi:uncharacterized protein
VTEHRANTAVEGETGRKTVLNSGQHILIFAVRLYRWTISPAKTFVFGPLAQCRYTPSCSQYALEAIQTHGALAGVWLAARRLFRCHPWGGCGDDPVPRRACDCAHPGDKFKPLRHVPPHGCLESSR